MLGLPAVLWLTAPGWKDTDPLCDFTTRIVSSFLRKLDIAHAVSGNTISLRNDTRIVTQECTAVNVMILFSSFVLAHGSSIKAKLLALVPGIPSLSPAT